MCHQDSRGERCCSVPVRTSEIPGLSGDREDFVSRCDPNKILKVAIMSLSEYPSGGCSGLGYGK